VLACELNFIVGINVEEKNHSVCRVWYCLWSQHPIWVLEYISMGKEDDCISRHFWRTLGTGNTGDRVSGGGN
jgi:hypothetical protein